ncbi:MAG: EH signature domain-containing protein [Thalassolituus sp.]|jgi:hypothetical protein
MPLILPSLRLPAEEWSAHSVEAWESTIEKSSSLQTGLDHGDKFSEVLRDLKYAISDIHAEKIRQIISTRIGARAITQLWIEDSEIRKKTLNPKSLTFLVRSQKPRISHIPLLNLVHLFFHYFDQLDKKLIEQEVDISDSLVGIIKEQLDLLPDQKLPNNFSLLHNLKRSAIFLIALDAPAFVVKETKNRSIELADYFKEMGLSGFDQGRFGDICRALYYLDILKELPSGEYHKVFAELEKPDVNKAAFEGSFRIGHKAIEILVDRSSSDPGDSWRNFILDVAGDPRIASSDLNYRQWWQPLGEERIEKVRGWLSQEDLKLFLKAVEQHGVESGDQNLQRMFPARKKFLEGLFEQGVIKTTRLMLGLKAKQGVHQVLGGKMNTSHIDLRGSNLSDKAVIYLNCGDFHIIQGSHNFKIWLYLNTPSRLVTDYGITSLDNTSLTSIIPREYRVNNPELPMVDITHHQNTWRNRVIQFLADNGIELDIEKLMTKTDYDSYIRRFGMPVVSLLRK